MALKDLVNKNIKRNDIDNDSMSTARDYFYTLQRSVARSKSPCQVIYDDTLVEDELSDKMYMEKHVYKSTISNITSSSLSKIVYPNFHINSTKENKSVRQVKVGEYIIFDDVYYIVLNSMLKGGSEYILVVGKCDYKLKWIADDNPNVIYERWIYKNIGEKVVKGNSFTEDIVFPNDSISLIVPRTELFQRTFTKDKRLMIGYNEITEVPSVYKIEGMTDLKNGDYDSGVIDIKLVADLFDESTDDKDRFIADILGYHYEYDLILNTPNALELNIDDTIQIDITVEKYDDSGVKQQVLNPKLIYLSSDESIVTVDENGLITAVDNGNANIIVSGYKKEVQINVNVSEEIISNMYIKSNNENYNLATQQNSEMYYFTTFVDGVEQADTYAFNITPKNDNRFSYEVMKNNKTLKITPTDYTCDIKVVLTSVNYPDLTKEINITVR